MTKRAMLFPGQGAQHPGMGRDIVEQVPAARRVMDIAREVLGFDLAALCFDGPDTELRRTDVCQPAILATSAAVIEALKATKGLAPSQFAATAGLSLGEYTALWFCGSLALEDALRLVRRRGQAMQDASTRQPSGMLSLVGATREQAHELVRVASDSGVIVAANYLGPGGIALAGDTAAIAAAEAKAKDCGVRRCVRLEVAGAFHSPLMAPATAALRDALANVTIRPPTIPFATNVTGDFVSDPERIREHLAAQVTSSVLWEDTMLRFTAAGIDGFVEPAPGKVLTGLMRKLAPEAARVNVESMADVAAYA